MQIATEKNTQRRYGMNKKLKVLVACEESQAVTIELRKLGHEAYSCDIEECSCCCLKKIGSKTAGGFRWEYDNE